MRFGEKHRYTGALELEDERGDVEVSANGSSDAENLAGKITFDHAEKAAQALSRGVGGVIPHGSFLRVWTGYRVIDACLQ
ncbi:MAG: hypothetical protein ACREVR_04975 [Burkholderiales bacterium]